jgi:hypothetical protein
MCFESKQLRVDVHLVTVVVVVCILKEELTVCIWWQGVERQNWLTRKHAGAPCANCETNAVCLSSGLTLLV